MTTISLILTSEQVANLSYSIANAVPLRTLMRPKKKGDLICIFGPDGSISWSYDQYPIALSQDYSRVARLEHDNHFWFPADSLASFAITQGEHSLKGMRNGDMWKVVFTCPDHRNRRVGYGMGIRSVSSSSRLRTKVEALSRELSNQ